MGDESNVHIGDPLVLTICLKDPEDGSSPAEFWSALQCRGRNVPAVSSFHSQSKEMHCMWRVQWMGQKQMSLKFSPSWL